MNRREWAGVVDRLRTEIEIELVDSGVPPNDALTALAVLFTANVPGTTKDELAAAAASVEPLVLVRAQDLNPRAIWNIYICVAEGLTRLRRVRTGWWAGISTTAVAMGTVLLEILGPGLPPWQLATIAASAAVGGVGAVSRITQLSSACSNLEKIQAHFYGSIPLLEFRNL
jgi:hypothetical protein